MRRVLIVDRHELVRRGVAELIGHEDDLQVCGEAGTCCAALAAIAAARPDLVITGLSFDDGDGLDLVSAMCASHPGLPVVVLSIRDSSPWAERALIAGASGFVSKLEIAGTLLVAVRAVLDGDQHVHPSSRANNNSG